MKTHSRDSGSGGFMHRAQRICARPKSQQQWCALAGVMSVDGGGGNNDRVEMGYERGDVIPMFEKGHVVTG